MKFRYSLFALGFLVSVSNATTLKDVVIHTIKNNEDIISKSINNEIFQKYVDEKEGGYQPKLDLTSTIETRSTKSDPGSNVNQTGPDIQLSLEQVLYDGDLTSSLVSEAKLNYEANKYKNAADAENIIFDATSAYLNMLKYDERINASNENIDNHNKYLEIAVQTEIINGEVLDKVQTKAKIHQAKSNLYEEINNKNIAFSSFTKNVGMRVQNSLCKPVIDESLIPSTFNELFKLSLKTNYSLLEQSRNIEAQRAMIEQVESKFKPTVKAKLQAKYDDELTTNDVETNTYSAKLEMTYNLYNGMSDKAASQRERLSLKEAQYKFNVISKSLEDELKVAYETYNMSKKQINELKELVVLNKQIIQIYKDQFESGTRSFIDVLNVESDLFNAKINLINSEYNMYQSYYKILKSTSNLQKELVNSKQTQCVDDRLKN